MTKRKKKCEHGRLRNHCKDCGGSGICLHNRRRDYCKDCGGKQICEHGTGGTAAAASHVAAKEFVSMGVIVTFVSSAAAKASVSIGNAMLCARSAVLLQFLHPRSLLLLLLLLLRLQLRLKRLRVHLRP
jgi:shikimate 5-dehydrogenase